MDLATKHIVLLASFGIQDLGHVTELAGKNAALISSRLPPAP
jgi:hypothetical protein